MCITFILYFFFEIKSIFLLLSCVSRFLFEDKVLLLLRPDESSTQTRSKRCPDPIVLHISQLYKYVDPLDTRMHHSTRIRIRSNSRDGMILRRVCACFFDEK